MSGVFQLFSDECRPDDILLSEDDLVWAKSRDLALDFNRPIPFLAFDDRCFYRQWAVETAQQPPHGFSIVLKCASVTGIMSSLRSRLGISLIGARQITDDLEIIPDSFAKPPRVATVLRTRSQTPTHATKALVRQLVAQGDHLPERSHTTDKLPRQALA